MEMFTVPTPDWEVSFFKVSGINPATNRKKSVEVVIYGSDENQAIAKSKLINILSVEKFKPVPTEAQINYGRDLGILYNDDYSKYDYSCLISAASGEEEYIPINKEAAEFGLEHGILFYSHFVSLISLYKNYYAKLTQTEKSSFYAFSVFQSLNGFTCYDYLKHPQLSLFDRFSEEVAENEQFIRSLKRYDSERYYGVEEFVPSHGQIKKTTNAYKICYDFFVQNGIITKIKNSATSNRVTVQKSLKNNSPIFRDNEELVPSSSDIKKKKSKSSTFAAVFASIVVIAVTLFFIMASCNK